MKEQIIYLEPDDDYPATRDRIGWAQAERVLLVWPKPRRANRRLPRLPLTRKLDLQLIQRHAERMGSRIALITDDPDIADNARDLHLPVFDSVDDSHLFPWPPVRKPYVPPPPDPLPPYDPEVDDPIIKLEAPKWLKNYWIGLAGRLAVFGVTLAVLLGLLAVTLPSAEVTLIPTGQQIVTRITLVADPLAEAANPTTGVIPAEVRRVVLVDNITINTSGVQDLATARAGGVVTFTNQTAQPIRIPAGTAVRTSSGGVPVRFVTQQDVELAGEIGATAEAPVIAAEPGPRGNVGTGLINQVEGPLSISVAVVNQRAMSGGDVIQVAAISADDQDLAETQLTERLRREGYALLQAALADPEFAPEASVRITRVLERSFSSNIGDQADTLTLTMRVEVAVTVVNENMAWPLGAAELNARAGAVLALLPESITFSRSDLVTVDDRYRVQFDVVTQGYAGSVIDPHAVQQAVAWLPVDEAITTLSAGLPLAAPPVIQVSPEWFPRLPWLPYQIHVRVAPEQQPLPNAPSGN